jgi:drug/metabolite transporter (DMT)-like permease
MVSSVKFVIAYMAGERKLWHWLAVGLLALIWGTSYILMKKGLESFSAIQIAALRIFITFLCLLPVALRNLKKISGSNIRSILIIGLLGNAIPAYLFPVAETKIASSIAGMLNALSPVFTLIIGITQVAGVMMGFAGAIGLLYEGDLSFNHYGLFVVLATILYGFSSNEVSRIKGLNGLQITSLSFFMIGPPAAIFLLFSDFSHAVQTAHWVRNLGFIAILAVMGSATALAIFYLLIRDTSPVFASIVTYFIPVVATLWGMGDNEHLSVYMLYSVVFILAGVYLINSPELFSRKYFSDKNRRKKQV